MTSRRTFLGALAASRLAGLRKDLNVLFVAVDDLRPDFGAYGSRQVVSPNLDALARSGMTFTRAYCQQAVCSPSRTSLLTGRRPDTTRIYELQTHFRKTIRDVVTLPQHFKNNGYATTGIGKIFHGGLDDAASWTIPHWDNNATAWGTLENAARSAKHEAWLKDQGWRNETPGKPRNQRGPSWLSAQGGDADQPDGRIADSALGALEKLRKERFFLAVGFHKPHLPFIAPSKYFDLYAKKSFELPPNPLPPKDAPALALHNSGELRNYQDIPLQGPIPEAKALELIRAYYASISFMDEQLGKLMAALRKMDLTRNTVVILWGDHGYHLGDHGLWNKHTNFEMATHSPLLLHVPGMRNAGKRTAALTEFVDIYPSLSEICGLTATPGLEGTSFVPLLDRPERAWKRAAFSQYPRAKGIMGYSMRTDRYRYTEWREPSNAVAARELYDHQIDPREDVNIAAQSADVVRQHASWLAEGWQAARPA